MKKAFRILVIFTLVVTSLSSCKKEGGVQPNVSVGVNNGGVWVSISFGGYNGGGYYYPNGYPNNWSQSNEFSFVGYMWTNPISNTNRPVFTSDGKTLVAPNGGIVVANIRPQMMTYLSYDPSKTVLVPVVITMRYDLQRQPYYVVE
ncbi:hypothetical protein IT400_02665 [Candidatus Nomurabacteria bacterium]|nr:hypothetical protein [Candidatus Nomurabacteria bacterium]